MTGANNRLLSTLNHLIPSISPFSSSSSSDMDGKLTSILTCTLYIILTLSLPSPLLVFSQTPLAPADAIFALTASYVADTYKEKVNLGVGAYRDNDGKPYVLPVVRKVCSFFTLLFFSFFFEGFVSIFEGKEREERIRLLRVHDEQ